MKTNEGGCNFQFLQFMQKQRKTFYNQPEEKHLQDVVHFLENVPCKDSNKIDAYFRAGKVK